MLVQDIPIGHVFVHFDGNVYLKGDTHSIHLNYGSTYKNIAFTSDGYTDCGKLKVDITEKLVKCVDISLTK